MRYQYILIGITLVLLATGCEKPREGCMDPEYPNYDSKATESDNCCCRVVRYSQDGRILGFNTDVDRPDETLLYGSIRLSRKDVFFEGPCGCIYEPREVCETYAASYFQPLSGGISQAVVNYQIRFVDQNDGVTVSLIDTLMFGQWSEQHTLPIACPQYSLDSAEVIVQLIEFI